MKPETNTEFLRNRLLQQAGLAEIPKPPFYGWTFEMLRSQECIDGFSEMMDSRIVMGCLRYGPIASSKPLFYDLRRAVSRLKDYKRTGNIEFLIDAANYCRLEFRRGCHPNKHFHAEDRK